MKKFLAMLLALAMVLSLSVTAFAADNEATANADSENKATIDVTGKYEKDYIDADTVISVDVAWDSMEFVYASKGYQGEWNPGDHKYDNVINDGTEDKWVKNTADITVTNHSNSAVEASFSFEKIATGITGTFDNESVILATAVETTKENAPKKTVTFTVGGTMAESDTKLGTITVAIAESDGIVWTSVASEDDLIAAISNGGYIKLDGDITLSDCIDIENTVVTLDLNQHQLSAEFSSVYVKTGGSLTIKNGTLVSSDDCPIGNDGGTLNVENCTLTGLTRALYQSEGTSNLKNCVANGVIAFICDGDGTVNLSNTTLNAGTTAGYIGLEMSSYEGDTKPGIICDFDPTNYIWVNPAIDNESDYYHVTSNGDGTWTVTYK